MQSFCLSRFFYVSYRVSLMTPSSGSQGMTALLQSKNLMLQSKNPSLLFDQGEGISCASQTVKTV